jgi:putative ABC transport system ATP-binding protein
MIELDMIGKNYPGGSGPLEVLREVTLDIEAGIWMTIRGPSGSGKSTLLHLLGLLDTPSRGSYRLNGRPVHDLSDDERSRLRNRHIGFIFQQFHLFEEMNVLENVTTPLLYAPASTSSEEGFQRALRLIERVGLSQRSGHRPTQLSGGEMQRAAIARALVNRPDLVLADEPTGNLDSATGSEIVSLLREIHREGATIVMITHDAELARLGERRFLMRDGTLHEDPS